MPHHPYMPNTMNIPLAFLFLPDCKATLPFRFLVDDEVFQFYPLSDYHSWLEKWPYYFEIPEKQKIMFHTLTSKTLPVK
jgi:hypothetical protein